MYLAVKFANESHRKKLPVGYPCVCRECADDMPCPEGYKKMSVDELREMKESMSREYVDYVEKILDPAVKKSQKYRKKQSALQIEINALDQVDEEDLDKQKYERLKREHQEVSDLIDRIQAFEEV